MLPVLSSLEDWQILIDVCPRPSLIVSRDEEIFLANKAFAALFGQGKDIFRGLSLGDVFEECPEIRTILGVEKVFETGERQRSLIAWRGGHWWIDLIPLKDRANEVRGVLLCFTNLETLIRNISSDEKIYDLLSERIENISTYNLQQKFDSLSLLVKGVVHDLKNLVNIAEGNLTLLEKAQNGKKKEEYLRKTKKSIQKIKEFSEKLLSCMGVEPCQGESDLAPLLKELLELDFSDTPGIKYVLEVPDNLWKVRIDQLHLTQIVQNILVNAKEALEGKGVVLVRAVNFLSQDDSVLKEKFYVRLTITDNGPGIPPEILNRIFDPYFSTKKDNYGLGLAIVYSVLKAYNGHLEVFSSPGWGTSFVLYLPAAPKTEEKPFPKGEKPLKAGQKKPLGKVLKAPRVLVVEDEDDLREIYQDFLHLLGCETRALCDPEKTLQVFKEAKEKGEPFDFVILDLFLPKINGEELLERIKELDPEARVIIATGLNDPSLEERLREKGAFAILKKPFGVAELAELIKGAG